MQEGKTEKTPSFQNNGAKFNPYDATKIADYVRDSEKEKIEEQEDNFEEEVPTSRVEVEVDEDMPTWLKKIRKNH